MLCEKSSSDSSSISDVWLHVEEIGRKQDKSIFGRKFVYLPAETRYREEWEIRGVKWLKLDPLEENTILAEAIIPKGWKFQRCIDNFHSNIKVLDKIGQIQAIIFIDSHSNSVDNICFSKIDFSNINFKPFHYSGEDYYCSYDEIIQAIESFGKVEAILIDEVGINQIFIVSFNKRIVFSESGIKANLEGGGIFSTPFSLREMSENGSNYTILSSNMLAFDIPQLSIGSFSAVEILESANFVPDEKVYQILKEGGKNWDEIYTNVDVSFSALEKKEKILEWIKQSGLAILNKGIHKLGDRSTREFSADQIIQKYVSENWNVVNVKKKGNSNH